MRINGSRIGHKLVERISMVWFNVDVCDGFQKVEEELRREKNKSGHVLRGAGTSRMRSTKELVFLRPPNPKTALHRAFNRMA